MDNGMCSAPRASTKQGQEAMKTDRRDVAARKPPSDLKHQQESMTSSLSFAKC